MTSRAELIAMGEIPFSPEERAKQLSQWYTDDELAARMVRFGLDLAAELSVTRLDRGGLHVLEPSAGDGALVRHIIADPRVTLCWAVDIAPENAKLLVALDNKRQRYHVERADFLLADVCRQRWLDTATLHEPVGDGTKHWFDVAIQNPPYENGRDVAFMKRALEMADSTVAHVPSDVFFTARRDAFWRWHRVTHRVNLPGRRKYRTPSGESAGGGMLNSVVIRVVRREVAARAQQCDQINEYRW